MTHRIASVVSFIFHPLLMPTLGLFIIFHSNTMESLLPVQFKNFIYILIFSGTCVLPASLIPLLIFRKVIHNPYMKSRSERYLPFVFTLLFYFLTILYLTRLPMQYITITLAFQIACIACIFIAFIINLKWKISLHLIGIGGIGGLILFLYFMQSQAPLVYLVVTIAIAGILAWARIITDSHSWKQIIAGLLTGFGGVWFVMTTFRLIPIL